MPYLSRHAEGTTIIANVFSSRHRQLCHKEQGRVEAEGRRWLVSTKNLHLRPFNGLLDFSTHSLMGGVLHYTIGFLLALHISQFWALLGVLGIRRRGGPQGAASCTDTDGVVKRDGKV